MAVAPLTQPIAIPSKRSAGIAKRFWRNPLAIIGVVLLVFLFSIALFTPKIARSTISKNEPTKPIFTTTHQGLDDKGVPHSPGGGFVLGADSLGRDVFTRVLYGSRISLIVALVAMLSSVVIGTSIGLLGGYLGGRTDVFLTRFTEIIVCLPTVLLAITLRIVLPDSLAEVHLFALLKYLHFSPRITESQIFKDLLIDPRLIIAIGLVTWTGIARAVRAQVRSLKEREFIEAAHALGVPTWRVLLRHLLPNVIPTVIALATLATASNILLEAGLSYLGLGDPAAPSWGSMIAEGQPYLSIAPWISLFPGFAIVVAVVAFNLVGNALNEAIR